MARSSKKKEVTSQKKTKKYREKTAHEHALDGAVKIMQELSEIDNVRYYIKKGTNQCTVSGGEGEMNVVGSCKVGFFTMDNKDNPGPSSKGYNVEYIFSGKVEKDNWNQRNIKVLSHTVEGLDFMEGAYV